MNRQQIDRSGWISLAAPWATALLTAAAIGGLWLFMAEDSPLAFSLLAGTLAVAVGVGLLWYSRERARRRLQAALEAYAEREMRQMAIRRRWVAASLRQVRTRSTALGLSATAGARVTPELRKG